MKKGAYISGQQSRTINRLIVDLDGSASQAQTTYHLLTKLALFGSITILRLATGLTNHTSDKTINSTIRRIVDLSLDGSPSQALNYRHLTKLLQ